MNTDEGYQNLCHAIVTLAVLDWQHMCAGRFPQGETFETIRGFFESDWGEMICGKIPPSVIMEKLERIKGGTENG